MLLQLLPKELLQLKYLTKKATPISINYASAQAIVGSHTGLDNKTLLLRPDRKMQNSWMMCDGPCMVYEKE